jgi:hypothetical protein
MATIGKPYSPKISIAKKFNKNYNDPHNYHMYKLFKNF